MASTEEREKIYSLLKRAYDHHYDGLCQIETFPDMQPPKWKAVTDAIEADIEIMRKEYKGGHNGIHEQG